MVPLVLTLMVNCFQVAVAAFGVRDDSSPFCNIILPVAAAVTGYQRKGRVAGRIFQRWRFACSTNGLKNLRFCRQETGCSHRLSHAQLKKIWAFCLESPRPSCTALPLPSVTFAAKLAWKLLTLSRRLLRSLAASADAAGDKTE